MPKSLRNLADWLDNLKTRVAADGPTCNQTPAQVTDDVALIDTMLTPTTDALTTHSAWVQAEGTARDAVADNDALLRDMINRYKAATGWTEGMAESWEVKTHEPQYDMDTQKPTISAHPMTGQVEIRGKKPGFSSVSIQMRPDGTTEWATIGTKINHFSFYDTTAPQTAGKPEKREYRALGYVGDNQVGQPSNIVTGIFA